MKKEELSPERLAVQRMAQEIHEANLKYERYTAKEFVTVTSRIPYRIGPVTLPSPFYKKHQESAKRPVCSITPPDDTVVMVNDGAVAIRDPSARQNPRYDAFDFRTGSSEDFHTIKVAIERWRRIPQNIHHRD